MPSKALFGAALLVSRCAPPVVRASGLVQQESAGQESNKQEAWQQEFDAVCSKTTDAMSLSNDELKSLVQRCDTLEPKIEKLDESRKKVYLRRLKQCRGLYAYVLESKNNDKK